MRFSLALLKASSSSSSAVTSAVTNAVPKSGTRIPARKYAELDYTMHMPKAYVERSRGLAVRRRWPGRFGEPDIVRHIVKPEDYVASSGRDWEQDAYKSLNERARTYHQKALSRKWFEKQRQPADRNAPIPVEQWTFFPGDLVKVLVGADKGKDGTVCRVNRATNEVWVDGLHTKLIDRMDRARERGSFKEKLLMPVEQPLDVTKDEVMLIDPRDEMPCQAEWRLDKAGQEWIRVSTLSGIEIPLPSEALVTYEYLLLEKYIEVDGVDTLAEDVLERTYRPTAQTFQQEIMATKGLSEEQTDVRTYWY